MREKLCSKWLTLHPYNIAQKVEIICEHFTHKVAHLLDGKAKAMVVTSSRESAVMYKKALDSYIKEHGVKGVRVMVAFSGKVEHEGKEYTESNMNPKLKGRDMRKAFDSNDYQIMVVANKFQTGFDQPKLVAMYVDKKLGGVECVQTLSRLNRTYSGKEQTFVLDFYNEAQDIKEAFEPYYQTTTLEDVTDPNLIYDLEFKLKSNNIFTAQEVENFAKVFFSSKISQAKMTSTLKPAVDRYKVRYQKILEQIAQTKEALESAKKDRDETLEHNLNLELKGLNERQNELDIFKKDLKTFVRMYEFLSQIVNYDDEELEKLWAFVKHLIPNLKTYINKEPIDISLVELTHYKLHKQKEQSIALSQESELKAIEPKGAVAKDPKKELLSYIVEEINSLFKGNFSSNDVINYAKTISDKMAEDETLCQQVEQNSQKNVMDGGFVHTMTDAVIESMESHQNMATEILSEPKVAERFANLIYQLLKESMERASLSINSNYGLGMVAESNGSYGKN